MSPTASECFSQVTLMMKEVALFGGTFDPIHFGHLRSAGYVVDQLDFNRLIFVPSASPPHKQNQHVTAAYHRLEMVRLAIRDDPRFACDDCEIQRPGPSYTIDTVRGFRERLGPVDRLAWIIGADSLAELAGWYRVGELVELCEIITVARPGWARPDLSELGGQLSDEQIERLTAGILNSPPADVSSTEIRRRVSAGEPIDAFTPGVVVDYIRREGLYR